MLPDGEKVRQYLGGVKFIGQAVPDRHAGKFRQLLYDGLRIAPVFDAVVHPTQHPGGVGDGFLFAHLGAGGAEIGHPHAQIVSRHLKGAAGAGGVLFKQQCDVLPLMDAVGDARFFLRLQLCRQIQQVGDLRRGEVQQRQKASAFQIHRFPPPSCPFT